MAEARRSQRRAEEMKRNSIFDDEYQYDSKTGEKTLVKRGAISLFEDSFKNWKKALDDPNIQTAELVDGEVIDDLIDACGEYYDMLRITGRDWPENFVFQDYIDARAAYGEDDLPTSQDVADRLSGRSDGEKSDQDDDEADDPDAVDPNVRDATDPENTAESSESSAPEGGSVEEQLDDSNEKTEADSDKQETVSDDGQAR